MPRLPRLPRTAAPLAAALAAALVCALALAACGTKQEVTSAPGVKPFPVMLDFFPNADHAALYSAIAQGDFRAVGLDVQPQTPAEPSDPLKLLAAGRVDMAISYEPELLLARDQGLKLVSIAALVQRPLTSIIALPGQHVSSLKDLAGRRVGTAGIPYQGAELKTALAKAGVNPAKVQEVNVGFNLVPAMLSGKVAATLGGFWNYEALQLQMLHKHPLVIPVNEAGVPNYDELVLVVREGEAHHDGQDLRAFLQALTRGEHYVREDPPAAAKLVQAANPSLEPKLQLESIERTLPAAVPAQAGKPYGYQDPAQWQAFGQWMYEHGLLKSNPNSTGLPPFTNEFLPGEGI
ncbi:MAG TPA: ABC transporter substrate-binding protein [Solirubrobacteraceae bacterium]|jgi:putative hydroxymethylpyrimidine transport system substrate-binding protein